MVKQETVRGVRESCLPASHPPSQPPHLHWRQQNVLVRENPPRFAADLAYGSDPLLIAQLRFILVIQAVPRRLSLSSSYHGALSIPSLLGSGGRATSLPSADGSTAPRASQNRLEGTQPTVTGSPGEPCSCSVVRGDADGEGRTGTGVCCALR